MAFIPANNQYLADKNQILGSFQKRTPHHRAFPEVQSLIPIPSPCITRMFYIFSQTRKTHRLLHVPLLGLRFFQTYNDRQCKVCQLFVRYTFKGCAFVLLNFANNIKALKASNQSKTDNFAFANPPLLNFFCSFIKS